MKKHIPNTITCCNLICGCIATAYAFYFNPQMALLFIILGAVFDFFDGMSARMLGVSSNIGKELDSLADDVTFGVAPSAMIFAELSVLDYPATAILGSFSFIFNVIPFLAFLVAAFSAVRLAKFNIDTRQTTSFIGLPTPANALFWGSLIVGFAPLLEQYKWFMPAILLGVVVSCWLLVAEIPMFALKFKQWSFKGNEIKYCFVIFSAAILIASLVAGLVLDKTNICWAGFCIIIVAYVLVSIATRKK